MGGQETLLLLARHPHLLAGAAAFDPVVDFALQYHEFPKLACTATCRKTWDGPVGRSLQALARTELGGSPSEGSARLRAAEPDHLRPRDRVLAGAACRCGGARTTRS